MTDDEMLKLAKKLKLPRIMWSSVDFRTALIRIYVAGQAAGAQCAADEMRAESVLLAEFDL